MLDWEAKRLAESQGAVTASLHSSAKSAIDFAKNNDVDIIYTRQMLSDMSGEELVRRIKRLRPMAEGHILSRASRRPSQCAAGMQARRTGARRGLTQGEAAARRGGLRTRPLRNKTD